MKKTCIATLLILRLYLKFRVCFFGLSSSYLSSNIFLSWCTRTRIQVIVLIPVPIIVLKMIGPMV